MKIIADENIPCVTEAFSTLGDVTLLSGRSMQANDVQDADVLLVRSVTRVDQELLAGSQVRFVGSATIGFDHIDRDYLESRGIGFATAPGSNAVSAAEYVVSCVLQLAGQCGFDPAGKTAGIVGCGNVGSRVRERLTVLGMRCLVNDPPLQAAGSHNDYVGLDAIFDADIVTLHVPLTRSGDWPTLHLADRDFLGKLKHNAILVNTARGAVVDNAALNELLVVRPDLTVVLDVWEGEPAINLALLDKVAIGTPHIAGYSLDGKLRGTEMIYLAACEFLQLAPAWQPTAALPERKTFTLADAGSKVATLRQAVGFAYDASRDDARLRKLPQLDAAEQPHYFDRLRKQYPLRREFSETVIRLAADNDRLVRTLRLLGFVVEE